MPAPTQAIAESKEFRGIVRIMGKDLKGQLELGNSLFKIKGIGYNFAHVIVRIVEKELGIARSTHVGDLTDNQIHQIEEIIRDPLKHGVPPYLLNRMADDDTGTNRHVVQSDLQIALHQDVEKERVSRTWIGWRHSIGQRVHGQHSRTTGRTGMTVGVLKKAIKAQKEAAAKGAQASGAPAKKEDKK